MPIRVVTLNLSVTTLEQGFEARIGIDPGTSDGLLIPKPAFEAALKAD